MNSKNLVLTALAHKEPSRVPVDYWGTRQIDELLCRHFGVESKDELLKKLDVDLRYVFPEYVGPKLKKYADGSYDDLWGFVEGSSKPLKEVMNHSFQSTECHNHYRWTRELVAPHHLIGTTTPLNLQCDLYQDYATVIVGDRTNRTSVLHEAMYLRGVQQALIDPIRNPEFTQRLFEKITDFYLEVNRRCFEAAGDRIDIFMMGTIWGLLVSPRIFRQFIKPYLVRHIKLAKQYALKVMLHSCGAIRRLIPDFIEMGIDILNPIQVRASGMNPSELKQEFGDRLSFHGSIDIQWTLPKGTPDDVRAEVRERIQTLRRGGGLILCSTHNIQADTPLENILAMYDEVKRLSNL